ncbi:ABC transporter permease [Gracilimonas mengyeensis]|uniref:ABC-type transport system, involved in lipoprotein release, permease component n=1 Tax=Gracilimonas mengyeensis TaxID=1302730 RepID=A0A521BFJ2_9BACT|nr:ABC transporter permease [Gracilimonas mengyeensis]SMO45839.1 ABC-type transport system, involved in lipoprotein release, permease component [Gracilimonas mengyeensis]
MLYLKLAWRNIWRNKRRSLITMASVVMAVLLSSVMSSMQEGQYDQMIDNTVGSFTGHLQIQHPDYFDESTLDNSLEIDSSLIQKVEAHPEVQGVIPRIDSYALAAGDDRSKAAMVVGIDPEAEKALSTPDQKISNGKYFESADERAVLVAEGLADFLSVSVGDTLVLLGQGFRGMSAAGAYPITGIVKFGLPDMNNNVVYLPMQTAQDLYAAYGRVTAAVVMLENPEQVQQVVPELQKELGEEYAVLGWQTLVPELVQAIEADRGSGMILLLILYMIVGFGILGTVLMMTAERKFEFGVMVAIGTARLRMSIMLILEMFFITLMGTGAGMVFSLPVMYYFNFNPLEFTGETAMAIEEYGMEPFIRFSTDPGILFEQGLIVLVITLVISLYPLVHMYKLKPVEAMRH